MRGDVWGEGAGCWFRFKGRRRRNKGGGEGWWSGHINYYQWNYERNYFICRPISNSIGVVHTSLYRQPGLSPTIILSVNSSTKTYMSSHNLFFLFFIFCLGFPWYLPIECFCRYILTELAMEKFMSVNIIVKYQQKKTIRNSVCICWISGSAKYTPLWPFSLKIIIFLGFYLRLTLIICVIQYLFKLYRNFRQYFRFFFC